MQDIKKLLCETANTVKNDLNDKLLLTDLELIMLEAQSDINKSIKNGLRTGAKEI